MDSSNQSRRTDTPSKQYQAKLSCFIGERMRESRNMAGLSQVDAAKRIGYMNSTKLAKVEKGQSTRIPLWLIHKVATTYDVSIDYLFGITETMERDDVKHAALRELHAFMFAEFDRRHAENIAELTSLINKVASIQELLVLATMQSQQALDDLDYIVNLPEWQDIKGGNRLVNSVNRIHTTLANAARDYKDVRKNIRKRGGVEVQGNLLLDI